jgi:hypothetical protein
MSEPVSCPLDDEQPKSEPLGARRVEADKGSNTLFSVSAGMPWPVS